jgi:hypothetical protein
MLIVYCKATIYVKITIKSISLHTNVLHIKLVQNLFNHNCILLLLQFHHHHIHHNYLHQFMYVY